MKKNIDTKEEAVTKDYSSKEKERGERYFTFPHLGVRVKAVSYKEALSKAKKEVKK